MTHASMELNTAVRQLFAINVCLWQAFNGQRYLWLLSLLKHDVRSIIIYCGCYQESAMVPHGRDLTLAVESKRGINIYGEMSVVRVHTSTLNVGSDVTIQRYSFFEILELILHSCNVNRLHIFRILHFLGRFIFFLMFQSYREIVIITLQFA